MTLRLGTGSPVQLHEAIRTTTGTEVLMGTVSVLSRMGAGRGARRVRGVRVGGTLSLLNFTDGETGAGRLNNLPNCTQQIDTEEMSSQNSMCEAANGNV